MGLAFRLGLRATHKEALLDDLTAGSNETVRFELDHPQGPDREGPLQQDLLRPF